MGSTLLISTFVFLIGCVIGGGLSRYAKASTLMEEHDSLYDYWHDRADALGDSEVDEYSLLMDCANRHADLAYAARDRAQGGLALSIIGVWGFVILQIM